MRNKILTVIALSTTATAAPLVVMAASMKLFLWYYLVALLGIIALFEINTTRNVEILFEEVLNEYGE